MRRRRFIGRGQIIFFRMFCIALLLLALASAALWAVSYLHEISVGFSRQQAEWEVACRLGMISLDNRPQRKIEHDRADIGERALEQQFNAADTRLRLMMDQEAWGSSPYQAALEDRRRLRDAEMARRKAAAALVDQTTPLIEHASSLGAIAIGSSVLLILTSFIRAYSHPPVLPHLQTLSQICVAILVVLSSGLFLLTVFLWVRGYRVFEQYSYSAPPVPAPKILQGSLRGFSFDARRWRRYRYIISSTGQIEFGAEDVPDDSQQRRYLAGYHRLLMLPSASVRKLPRLPARPIARPIVLTRRLERRVSIPGLIIFWSPAQLLPQPPSTMRISGSVRPYTTATADFYPRTMNVKVSCWLLVLLSLPLPAWWVWRQYTRFRRRRLIQRDICPSCGYDLRATPNRCPECGLRISPPRAARPAIESPAPIG